MITISQDDLCEKIRECGVDQKYPFLIVTHQGKGTRELAHRVIWGYGEGSTLLWLRCQSADPRQVDLMWQISAILDGGQHGRLDVSVLPPIFVADEAVTEDAWRAHCLSLLASRVLSHTGPRKLILIEDFTLGSRADHLLIRTILDSTWSKHLIFVFLTDQPGDSLSIAPSGSGLIYHVDSSSHAENHNEPNNKMQSKKQRPCYLTDRPLKRSVPSLGLGIDSKSDFQGLRHVVADPHMKRQMWIEVLQQHQRGTLIDLYIDVHAYLGLGEIGEAVCCLLSLLSHSWLSLTHKTYILKRIRRLSLKTGDRWNHLSATVNLLFARGPTVSVEEFLPVVIECAGVCPNIRWQWRLWYEWAQLLGKRRDKKCLEASRLLYSHALDALASLTPGVEQDSALAAILNGMALTEYLTGNYLKAVKHEVDSLKLLRAYRERHIRQQVAAYAMRLGDIYRKKLQAFNKSRASYAFSLRVARECGDSTLTYHALKSLAHNHASAGQLGESLQTWLLAEQTALEGKSSWSARTSWRHEYGELTWRIADLQYELRNYSEAAGRYRSLLSMTDVLTTKALAIIQQNLLRLEKLSQSGV